MTAGRPAGAVRVTVPATSANLGPGFDALGLALACHDVVEVRVTDHGLLIEVEGEGAGELDVDEGHLVVRALRAAFARVGAQPAGLAVRACNAVPQGRGLGSSAAAVVVGVVAARALSGDLLSLDDCLELAAGLEGHADNVAAALHGGLTVSWQDGAAARTARLEPDPRLRPVVYLPAGRTSTSASRGRLPALMPHAEAAAAAGRAALLVAALTSRPELLLPATQDWLHQPYRLPSQPATADLLARLRAEGVAAVLSGSGPAVLALPADEDTLATALAVPADGFAVRRLDVDTTGARAERLDP